MEYLKNLMFWRKEQVIEEALGLELTDEQRKKYRKQYLRLAYNTYIISLTYILGTMGLIYFFFQGNIWALAIVVVLLRDYKKLTLEWKAEVELIQERIEKRVKKNRKQNLEVKSNELHATS